LVWFRSSWPNWRICRRERGRAKTR